MHPGSVFTLVPEAMGVHVIRTAQAFHVPIVTRPRRTVFKVGLVGYPKSGVTKNQEEGGP